MNADDIESVALPAQHRRYSLHFEAEAEGVATDTVIQNILDTTMAEAHVAVKDPSLGLIKIADCAISCESDSEIA